MTVLLPAPLAPEVRIDRVEALLAVLLASAAAWGTGPRPLTAGLLWLAAVTPRLIATDQAEHRLPDAVVLPGVPIALAAVLADAAATGGGTVAAALAALLYAGGLLALHALGGMGLGDVKLAVPLGLLTGGLGTRVALASPVLAFLAGGVAAAVLLARRGPGARLPFGPAMLLGCWAAVLLR